MQHWLKGISFAGLLLASGVACFAAPRHARPVQTTVVQATATNVRASQPATFRTPTLSRPGEHLFQPTARARQVKKPAAQRRLSMQQVNQFAYRETHPVEPGMPVEQAADAGQ